METGGISDFTFESKSQTPEEMSAAIAALGLEVGETEVKTDDGATPNSGAPNSEVTDGAPPAEEKKEPVVAAAEPEKTPEPVVAATTETQETERLSRRQRAIARSKAEMDSLREANDKLTRELAEARQAPKPAVTAAEPVKPEPAATPAGSEPAAKPNPDTFDSGVVDPAYIEALADWKFDERERQKAEKDRQAAAAAETSKRTQAEADAKVIADAEAAAGKKRWADSEAAAREEYPDFDDVMQTANPNIPKPMVVAVLDRASSAHLAYHLTSHPEEEKRIAKMAKLPEKFTEAAWRKAYARVDRELDRIEEQLGLNVADGDDDEPAPAAAAPPKPAAPVAAAPAAAATPKPIKPKPTIPSTVGSRGTPNVKNLRDLPAEELRKLDPLSDDYRRQMGMQ